MNKSLNVFLSVLLCVVLCVGVLTSLYTTDDSSVSEPQYGYSSSTSTGVGAPALSFGTSASGDGLAVPMSSSRSRGGVRHLSSHRFVTSSPNSLIASSPNSLITSSPNSLITYMSSSQKATSFGGGSNTAGVSMSGGVVSTNNITTSSPNNFTTSSSNNLLALSPHHLITSSPNTLLAYSPEDILSSSNGMSAISGRRNAAPGVEQMYWEWLTSYWGEDEDLKGWAYYQGENTITYDELYALFLRMTEDSPMFNTEEAWISFYNWFMGNMDGDGWVTDGSNRWKLQPISDAIPFLLLLSALWAWMIFRRNKKSVLKIETK